MKKILFIILSLVILVGCRSLTSKGRSVNAAEKQIKNGNYYEAVSEFTNALINDSNYKPAVEGLNSVFDEAVKKQEETISMAKTNSSLVSYANETEKMAMIYKNISRLRPETFTLLNFKLDIEDIKFWNNETSKAYYEAAKNYSPRQTTFDYKTIAKLYKKSYLYNPRYQDNFEKYKETKDLAMQKIIYFDIKSEYNYFNMGSLLTNKIFALLTGDPGISEFTSFSNGTNQKINKNTLLTKNMNTEELKNNNYFLDIEVSSISFPRTNPVTNYRNKTWYEVTKKVNGVIKKEAVLILPKALDPQSTYEEKKYTEISTYKEVVAKISLNYKLIDLKTKNIVKSGTVTDESKDSHTSVIFIGNAYPEEKPVLDKTLMSDFNLLETLSNTVSEKLKNELKAILE